MVHWCVVWCIGGGVWCTGGGVWYIGGGVWCIGAVCGVMVWCVVYRWCVG